MPNLTSRSPHRRDLAAAVTNNANRKTTVGIVNQNQNLHDIDKFEQLDASLLLDAARAMPMQNLSSETVNTVTTDKSLSNLDAFDSSCSCCEDSEVKSESSDNSIDCLQ